MLAHNFRDSLQASKMLDGVAHNAPDIIFDTPSVHQPTRPAKSRKLAGVVRNRGSINCGRHRPYIENDISLDQPASNGVGGRGVWESRVGWPGEIFFIE